MKLPYSNDMRPAGMVVSVSVGPIDGSFLFSVDAKIDTGADMTALPEDLLREYGFKPDGHIDVRGAFDKELKRRKTFFAKLQFDGGAVIDVEAVGTPKHRGLLGRDVLNDYVLVADGPQELFELAFGDLAS